MAGNDRHALNAAGWLRGLRSLMSGTVGTALSIEYEDPETGAYTVVDEPWNVIIQAEATDPLWRHCRSCGALPGEECQSQSRHHNTTHAARSKNYRSRRSNGE